MKTEHKILWICKIQRPTFWISVVTFLFIIAGQLCAIDRVWKTEEVGSGTVTAIAVDASLNLHVVFLTDGGQLQYAFRPHGSDKWFAIQFSIPRITLITSSLASLSISSTSRTFALRWAHWNILLFSTTSGQPRRSILMRERCRITVRLPLQVMALHTSSGITSFSPAASSSHTPGMLTWRTVPGLSGQSTVESR